MPSIVKPIPPVNFNAPPAVPRLALLALTLAVLLLHGWLLQAAPQALQPGQVTALAPTPSFVTRMVTPASAAPAPSPAQAVAPSPVRVQAPKAVSQPNAQSLKSTDSRATLAQEASQASTQTPPEESAGNTANPATQGPDAPVVAQATPAPAPQEQTPPSAPAQPEASSPAPLPVKLPAPVRLKYAVQANKFPFSLNAELLWQHDGTSYDARLTFGAFGQSRVQTSRGNLVPLGLAPIRFSDKYRAELAAHFNHEAGKITFSANTPDAPLMAGAQDRLSVLVQLAALIASDPAGYPPATTITLQTVGPREASPWLFTVQAPETLTLPGGVQTALKLQRLPRRDYDQKVELWLAPALGYLPARIKITEHNGDYIDQQWQATETAE